MHTTFANILADAQERRGRGRPKKKPRFTPEKRSFDEIAAGIQAIPKHGGAWYGAKEAALKIIDGDKHLVLHPSCMKLIRAILEQLNHDSGYDFGGRDHYAALCGMDVSTYRKAMKSLCLHGHAMRRQVSRPGAYDLWQTTLPVLLAGHEAAERKRHATKSKWEAGNSDLGGRIIEFPAQSGRPNGLLIPLAAVAVGEGEHANPAFKSEDSAAGREDVLSFLSEEHCARFEEVDALWGGTGRPAAQVRRYLHDLVVQARKTVTIEDVEKTLLLTLALCEEEAARPTNKGKRGRITTFFAKAFEGQLHELRKSRLEREEELRHVPDLEAAKHAAALKTLTAHTAAEEQIAQLRPAAFEQMAAANRAEALKARHEPRSPTTIAAGGWYLLGADGRQVFADHAKLLLIGFHSITGAVGNKILREVPGATAQDVLDILIAVSGAFSPEQERSKTDVPIAAIVDKAIDMLKVRVAYAEHGTPEQLCGGSPSMMTSEWVAFSEDLVATVTEDCPLVRPDERAQVWAHVAFFATTNRARYGQGLQQEAEAKFKELMAQRQQAAAREREREQERARQAEVAQQQRRRVEAAIKPVAEAEVRSLYGAAWDALPARETDLLIAEAVTSLCGSGCLGDAQRRKDDEGYRLAEQQAFLTYIRRPGFRLLANWFELNREDQANSYCRRAGRRGVYSAQGRE